MDIKDEIKNYLEVHQDFELMCKLLIPKSRYIYSCVLDWRCGKGLFGLFLLKIGILNINFADQKIQDHLSGLKTSIIEDELKLSNQDTFDLIICHDFDYIVREKDWRKELDFLIEHLRTEGFIYILSKNDEILHRIDEDNNIYLQHVGFNEIGRATIFQKTADHEHGIRRFNCINRQFVGDIQKEAIRNCVFSFAKEKEPILVIGGPIGEMPFPAKVYALNIDGYSDFGHIRADRPLPIKDNTFALLQSSHVLEHCEDLFFTLKEWTRILKPGALMLHFVPIKRFHSHLMDEDFKIGDRCFQQFNENEMLELLKKLDNIDIIQFDTEKNNFEMDIILRKKS